MAYIDTYDTNNDLTISVFPSARRTSTQNTARVMTEKSQTEILNKLIDYDGYVQSESFEVNGEFIFDIYGYLFNISRGIYLTSLFSGDSSVTSIYGKIELDSSTNYLELSGQDTNPGNSDSKYHGISFLSTQPEDGIYLKLLEKNISDNTWNIPKESMRKFKLKSIDFIIDGGEIV